MEDTTETTPPSTEGGDNSNAGDGQKRGKPRRFGRRGPGRRRPAKARAPNGAEGGGAAPGEARSQGGVAQTAPEAAPIDDEIDPDKPQRLHKALAQTGLGSRRQMETLIADGQVEINGEVAQVGQTVQPGDRVHVKRRKVNVKLTDDKPRVMIYHKPPGEIVSRDDPEGRPTVFDSLKAPDHGKWIAVGRLDFNSEGLLLFTTFGELSNRLMHPRYEIVREYSVRVLGELTHEQEDQLIDGIELEDGPARVLSLVEEGGDGANRWYRITLQEGRNREVRRMFEALGLTVSRLIRIRYGTITMPSWLKRGQTKLLDEAETFALLESVGLRSNSARAQAKRARKGGVQHAPVGVMRNAREHEAARDGRTGNPNQPARASARPSGGNKRGKKRVDPLSTSFGFANAGQGQPRARGPRPNAANAIPGNTAGGAQPQNRKRGKGNTKAGGNPKQGGGKRGGLLPHEMSASTAGLRRGAGKKRGSAMGGARDDRALFGDDLPMRSKKAPTQPIITFKSASRLPKLPTPDDSDS